MSSYLIRALLALGLAAFLWAQAQALATKPQRRRAFLLGTAALIAFAMLNGGLALGLSYGWLQLALGLLGTALFVAAVVTLIGSVRSGEAGDQRDQIAAAAREFRERKRK